MEDTAARSNIPALVWILEKLNACPYVASADAAVVYLRLAAEQIAANPSLLEKRAGGAADRVPTLEELIDDCITHQDVPQAIRLTKRMEALRRAGSAHLGRPLGRLRVAFVGNLEYLEATNA